MLRELVGYWQRKRGERKTLRLSDVDPLEIGGRLLPHLMLVDVEHGSEPKTLRFRFRLIGTYVVATMGRDNTGKYFEEVYPAENLPEMTAGLRWVLENRAPMRSTGNAEFADKGWRELEFLLLPLTDDDGGDVCRIILALDDRPMA